MELQVPSLVGTVYGQSWPVPGKGNHSQKTSRRGFQGFKKTMQRPPKHQNSSGDRLRRRPPPESQPSSYDDPLTIMTTNNNSPRTAGTHTQLDRDTEFWKNWTKRSPRSNAKDSDSEEARDDEYDLSLYRITQDTFRKLTDQVKEVNDYVMNKGQPSSFKRYYTVSGCGQPSVPAIRHSQLAAAIAASRKQRLLELESESDSHHGNNSNDSSKVFPLSIEKNSRQLQGYRSIPKSSSLRSRPNSRMSHHNSSQPHPSSNYNHLTPEIAMRLGDTLRATPFYVVAPGPFHTTIPDSPTPGSDSEEKSAAEADSSTPKTTEEEEEEAGDQDTAAAGLEGDEYHRRSRGVTGPPEFVAEDFEALEDEEGQRCNFKYKHKLVAQTRFDYLEPLEAPFDRLDLAKMGRVEGDWKELLERKPSAQEEQMLERLVEMTRFTGKTIEWEQEKLKSSSKRAAQKSGGKVLVAAAAKARSKNCLEGCVQPNCLGECRQRQQALQGGGASGVGCPHCRQLYCTGSCTEYGYHHHVRSAQRMPLEDPVRGQRPKSCRSCGGKGALRSHRINLNNRTLGRPRSANATFSTANLYTLKPRLITPVMDDDGGEEGGQTPPPGRSRPSTGSRGSRGGGGGRDGILLHKSWESQRKNSLTEPIRIDFVKANAVRVKSARKKSKSRKKK